MNLDKFIDDGDGLIITPPKEDVEKYNQCHGPGGKFCSSGKGAGGGGASEGEQAAESYPGFDEAAQRRYEEENRIYRNEDLPGYNSRLEGGTKIKRFDNMFLEDQLSDHDAHKVAKITDEVLASAKVRGRVQLRLEEIDNNLGIVRYTMNDKGQVTSHLSLDPTRKNLDTFGNNWASDRVAIAKGELPWGAESHASDVKKAYRGVIVHEVAHVKMAEYMIKQPQDNWLNPNSPSDGPKGWKDTINKAHFVDGWKGPSRYARTDPGEMFAECATMLTYKSTTGHPKVDKFVKEVWSNV